MCAIFLQLRACSVISDDFHLAFCIRKGTPQYRSMRKAGERGGAELRWALSLPYIYTVIVRALRKPDIKKSSKLFSD
jgi:hypothetical protein